MFFVLRIIFTILAAACLVALVPISTIFDGAWAVILLVGAGIFFLALLFCKQEQQIRDKQKELDEKQITAPSGDFLNPVSSETTEPQVNNKPKKHKKKKHKKRK